MLAGSIAVRVLVHALGHTFDFRIELLRNELTHSLQNVFAIELPVDRGERMHLAEERLGRVAVKQVINQLEQAAFRFVQELDGLLVSPFPFCADIRFGQRFNNALEVFSDLVVPLHNVEVGGTEVENAHLLPNRVVDRHGYGAVIYYDAKSIFLDFFHFLTSIKKYRPPYSGGLFVVSLYQVIVYVQVAFAP